MEREIKIILYCVSLVIFISAFYFVLESLNEVRGEIVRLEKQITETNKELDVIKKELAVNNAICDQLINSKWD